MRIAFLFNHVAAHQVPHAAPYAFELSRRHPRHEVVIACSSAPEFDFVQAIAALYPGHRCEIVRLRVPKLYELVDRLVAPLAFGRKRVVLKANLAFFRTLDAIVAPERNCLHLRTRHGLERLVMIHARHGAGDRKGGFDSKSGAFDLTLLPGRKYVERLRGLGYLDEGAHVEAGWPKFEVCYGLVPERRRLFDNDNPVVVYNPHFDQRVASWRGMGVAVLDYFAAHPEYNLIFAPHLVLFRRYLRHAAFLPRRFRGLPNILIDTGSQNSVDMTYMRAADIYLGDVSSQVYEFLYEPRPCIFLNAHGVDWRDDPSYAHWHLGQVVDDVRRDLGPALAAATSTHDAYRERQQAAFDYTFVREAGRSAAARGADGIADYLASRGAPSPCDSARANSDSNSAVTTA